jgi:mannosyltransferase OCH1-like enzyme
MISKKIYQTWFTKKLDSNILDIIDNMKQLNSSYDYELYDDDDMFYFIKENYGKEVISAYESLQIGAAKADLWRYLILYKNGGIYLDIDSSIYSNLDNLINVNDKAIISRETNKNLFVQWCLMFDKNHPILEKTIKRCILNIRNKISNDILYVTGPQVYSRSIREIYNKFCIDVYNTDDDVVNAQIKHLVPQEFNCKIYSFDYKGYCNFKHNKSDLLYIEKSDWRTESLNKNLFKL